MDLTPHQEQRLRRLVSVFLAENAKLNLSAFRMEEACWVGNVLDSLALLDVQLPVGLFETPRRVTLRSPERAQRVEGRLECATGGPPQGDVQQQPLHVIEVGTGGGFPALPLAIMKPEWEVTAIDATAKKVAAVRRIVDTLRVAGCTLHVRCIVGRVEELGHDPSLRESFDLVLARAVAELPTLLELMSPFARAPELRSVQGAAKRGGVLVCWKSMNIEEELNASRRAQELLGVRFFQAFPYDLGEGGGKRQLLLFQKTATLSARYPRGVGIPAKKPL